MGSTWSAGGRQVQRRLYVDGPLSGSTVTYLRSAGQRAQPSHRAVTTRLSKSGHHSAIGIVWASLAVPCWSQWQDVTQLSV